MIGDVYENISLRESLPVEDFGGTLPEYELVPGGTARRVKLCRHCLIDLGFKKTESKLEECVCHIYGMDDDKLIEFYKNVMLSPEHYTSPAAQKQYPRDKAEVEEEIRKRGLSISEGLKHIILRKEGNEDWELYLGKGGVLYMFDRGPHAAGKVKMFDSIANARAEGWRVVDVIKENLTDYAQKELERAGLFDKDSDYGGMLGEAVLALIELFAKQDHSGFSAGLTRELFNKLSSFKPLTEITDDPDEWISVTDCGDKNKPIWQSSRSPSLFSNDEGKTYWDIDEDYFYHTDEDGIRSSGGLSEEEWDKRSMHNSKHIEKKEG